MMFKEIQEILYRSYERLPRKVKAFVRPVARVFLSIKRAFSLACEIRLSAYLLQGKERRSGGNLTTLFLGGGKGLLYVSSLVYSEEPVKKGLGKVFIWRVKSKLNLDFLGVDLVFVKMDGFFSRFFTRLGFLIIPEWSLFMLDLSEPFQEARKLTKNKKLRETLRRIKKYKYSWEVTQDPIKFEYFYRQMYLPYATKRFGELSVLAGFGDMERVFRKGLLLLVKKGNDYISGQIMRMYRDTVFAPYLGITEGRMEYLKAGALTALYHFSIIWAQERGCKWFDFGHCRSFLKDGGFNYKKQWGMMVKISTRLGAIFGMKVRNFHQGVRNFLENNPFIFIDQKRLKGMILAEQNHPLTIEEVQSLVNTYSITGLDSLVILSDQGFTREAEEFGCSNRRVDLISRKPDAFFEALPGGLPSGRT